MKNANNHEMAGRMKRARGSRQRTKPVSHGSALAHLGVKRILVPLDFSEAAGKSLAYATALAADMKAKIILLHVIEPVYVSADPGLTYMPQQTAIEKKSSLIRLRKIAATVPKHLFDKVVVRSGAPYDEIATAAERLQAGLIVLTTHGRTGLRHALLGSTAERVVRHAKCPVLTVRRS
jgi:nucleotide-binding universal stress UspA family protein